MNRPAGDSFSLVLGNGVRFVWGHGNHRQYGLLISPRLTMEEALIVIYHPTIRDSGSKRLPMLKLDQLRRRQEQRLWQVLESWNEAKLHLEKAIALAETREREYRDVSDDVRRRLDALELVIGMASELGDGIPAERSLNVPEKQAMLMLPENANGGSEAAEGPGTAVQIQGSAPDAPKFDSVPRASSRPLFTSDMRSRLARLSILQ